MNNLGVIYTGGTLGMELKAGQLVAANMDLNLAISNKWLIDTDVNLTFIEQEPIDSANAKPNFYIQLSKTLHKLADKFTGLIILHGTDTMEYTASMLAFLCIDLDLPIILTGAQLPLFKNESDAEANIKNAILWCISEKVKGVNIAFGKYLVRGINSYKHSSTDFNTFRNTAEGFIGKLNAKGNLELYTSIIQSIEEQKQALPTNVMPTLTMVCQRINNLAVANLPKVVRISLFPGIDQDELINYSKHAEIIFIEAYASGTAPEMERFLGFLEQKIQQNAKVILLSQARHDGVIQSEYATNLQAKLPSILSGANMTFATAFAKAVFLNLADLKDASKWNKVWQTNLIGEFSIYKMEA